MRIVFELKSTFMYRFQWTRTDTILGTSSANIAWQTDPSEVTGTYRLRHSGYHKRLLEDPLPFTGVSRSFTLQSKSKSYKALINSQLKNPAKAVGDELVK